ncbi:LacI family DNA-binding transcriptional regulator [Pontiella sulfatireligans]|uniref:HTH-type transcriptional regulator MalR n=1 Tax=Pontiella sulfatireligans TaxID=2750658 RepID=A0A6C2UHS3_9BACT|nr:LacI family DNA-binding transcriptional regulator [Pontiella sulfatireligans]VGO19007.1 HTH-type transcriptional regulator MalR [Pontiella sulfatireligans]
MARQKNKEDFAYQHIRKLIDSDRFQPGDLLPTESALSEELGINRTTISKAMAALKNEGYVERRAGRGTMLLRKAASNSTKMILVISPWPTWDIKDEQFYPRLIYAMQTEAIHNGMATINIAIHGEEIENDDFTKIRDIYKAYEFMGAIVIDPFLATHGKLQEFLTDLECPTVWAGSSQKGVENAHCIDIDDYQAAFDLTEKLINTGAKNIAYISYRLNTTFRNRRMEGYKTALEKYAMDVSEQLIIFNSTPVTLKEAGRECAGIYTARNLDADAVVLSDLRMLDGIISFCNQLQTPPLLKLKQLPFATFDYEKDHGHTNIRFSATQPIEEIGASTVQMLIAIRAEKSDIPQIQILNHEIHTLNSTTS